MGTGSRDVIAVWIQDCFVYVGYKRIYNLESNKGYVIEEWRNLSESMDDNEWVYEAKTEALDLASRVSSESGMPIMVKWDNR